MNNSSSGDDEGKRDLEPIDDFGDMEDGPDYSEDYDDNEDGEFDEFGELEDEEIEILDSAGDEDPGDDLESLADDPDYEDDDWEEEFDDSEEPEIADPQPVIGDRETFETTETDTAKQQPAADGEQTGSGIPWGLIAVAVIALGLLGAGGYGVLGERAANQEEIRRLQSELGKAISKTEAEEMITTLGALKERNSELEGTVATLSDANLALDESVASLETQMVALKQELAAAQAAKATPSKPASPSATTKPATTRQQTTNNSAEVAEKVSGWFVNFSTYGRRSDATSWASRLESSYGRVVIAPFEREGKTLYRVRVVGLADRAEAEATAAELERLYQLPKLWIGKE